MLLLQVSKCCQNDFKVNFWFLVKTGRSLENPLGSILRSAESAQGFCGPQKDCRHDLKFSFESLGGQNVQIQTSMDVGIFRGYGNGIPVNKEARPVYIY